MRVEFHCNMHATLATAATPSQPMSMVRAFSIGLAFIVGYVVLAWLSRHYLVRPFAITAWYPAAGLAMGLLLVFGMRFWPALAIASTCNFLVARGLSVSPHSLIMAPLIITTGYAGMAALLSGPLGFRNEFDRVRDVWLLVAVSAVGTLLMGLAYVSALRLDSAMTLWEFTRSVMRFWIGHLVGIVINTPLLLLLIDPSRISRELRRRSRLEIGAQMAAAMVALLVIFAPQWPDEYKLFYVLFMPLIWIATRSGIVGAVLGIAIIQLGLIVAILNSGFQHGTVVTEFQFMMLALAVTGLFLGMFVTERGAAHDALDRSESRLRAMVSTVSYGIITIDERDVIVAANPAAAEIFRIAQERLVGTMVRDVIPDFERAAHSGEAFEAHGIRGDGSTIPLELAVGVTSGGASTLRIAIVRDISRRKELEKKYNETQAELNRSMRLAAAGEMAAALAHELHQPLSAIRNYASASRLVPGANSESALMRKVEGEAVRAAEIVQRLRDFFQAGTSRLERIDVGELIGIALAHARDDAAKKGVNLRMTVAPKVDLLIDRVQIETVLHCLIGNAIDSLAAVEAGARQVRVEAARRDEGWINVSVIDSGPGISPVMIGRLFEPFATNKPSGIGLGLSVSRSLVEAHGGRLWAESGPAGGAAFHFSLPTAELKQGCGHDE